MSVLLLALTLSWTAIQLPDQGGTVTGVVRNDVGDAVAGALVTLLGGETTLVVQSDAAGHFAFVGLQWATSYSVIARKAGYLSANSGAEGHFDVSPATPRRSLVIPLRRTSRLAGRVLLSDGRPAVAAAVEAWCFNASGEPRIVKTATTDDRGHFRIDSIVSDKCFVEARTSWQSGSTRLATADASAKSEVARYPAGSRSVENALTMRLGETIPVGDLVVDIESVDVPVREKGIGSFLKGRVVELRTKVAVFPAVVSAEDERLGVVRTAATDVGGHFLLDLPPGAYRVWGSGPGYVADRSGAQLIRVTDGPGHAQHTEQTVTLSLVRAGAIGGRVYADNGEPLQGAAVHLYRERYVLGEKRLVTEPEWRSTDDRGEFRFFGLQPGSYFLSASFSTQQEGKTEKAGSQAAMSPSFYPSGSASDAAPLPLSAEGDIDDLLLTWSPSDSRTLAVQVFSVDGSIASGTVVNVAPTLRSHLPSGLECHAVTSIDGTARFSGLAEGEYYVHALGDNSQFGFEVVDVSAGGPIASQVKLGYGSEVRGRIIDSSTGLAPVNASSFLVRAFPISFDDVPTIGSTPRAEVAQSGEFIFRNMWGSALIRIVGPSGFYLKRVLSDGIDVTNDPLHFGSSTAPHLITIEVDHEHTFLSGRVTTSSGAPVLRCAVIAFATDQNRLGPWSRFLAAIPCGGDSSFNYSDLPEGQYSVFAITSIKDAEMDNREWLEAHREYAQTVRLTDGTARSISLRLYDPVERQ